MRYSLVSRFRGTLEGAILGENLVETRDIRSLHWQKMAIMGGESLISLGRFDLDDWRQRQQKELPDLDIYSSAILAVLPVALYYHENTIKMRQNLLHVVEIWDDDPVLQDGTLAVGYALAQCLTEKLSIATLIPQTISFIGETSTNLPQELLKVNNLLNCGATLEMAQAELSKEEKLSNVIAMAFYCFLSTLEDFRLSVLRATQNGNCSQIAAITGALSGAYNSITGIPVTWQVGGVQAKSAEWKLTSFSVMVELSNALVAAWSGVYNVATCSGEVKQTCTMAQNFSQVQAIASPRVIRLR